jgi:hypothetical protein
VSEEDECRTAQAILAVSWGSGFVWEESWNLAWDELGQSLLP